MPSPNYSLALNDLPGLAAVSPSDVWAVGYTFSITDVYHMLVEHWDGTAWAVVPSPDPTSGNYTLAGASAAGPSDVWAVGSGSPLGGPRTLTAHWDGQRLERGPQREPGQQRQPAAWRRGGQPGRRLGRRRLLPEQWRLSALAEHWDGTAWTVAAVPPVSANDFELSAVAWRAAGDVWAVGYATNASNVSQTLVAHWNGTAWSIVPSPNVGFHANALHAVAALAPDDVWAAGSYRDDSAADHALLEHWDGSAWHVVAAPATPYRTILAGLAATGPAGVWAGNDVEDDGLAHAVTLHWDGSTWTRVPSGTTPAARTCCRPWPPWAPATSGRPAS